MVQTLAIVTHSYFHPQWQGKLLELGNAFDSVYILQPERHFSNSFVYRLEVCSSLERSNVKFLSFPAFLESSPSFYGYWNPFSFVWALLKLRPSVILLEEDPHSVCGALTIASFIFLRILTIRIRLVLFTWDNLNKKPKSLVLRFLKYIANIIASKLASGLIAGNQDALELAIRQKGFRCPAVVLPLIGVPSALPRERNSHDSPFVIGYVGRVISIKGLSTLFEAFERIMLGLNAKLLIVGGGEDLASYKHKYIRMSEKILFTGPVCFEDVYVQLAKMDVLVLPSVSTSTWKEQYGLVLAQAMSMAIPCIGSDSGAIPNVISDRRLIFKQNSSDELASILLGLLSSASFYDEVSTSAYKRASLCLTSSSVGKNYSTFLRSLSMASVICHQPFPYDPVVIVPERSSNRYR